MAASPGFPLSCAVNPGAINPANKTAPEAQPTIQFRIRSPPLSCYKTSLQSSRRFVIRLLYNGPVSLLRHLRKLWKTKEEHEMPYSIVLLLRQPHIFAKIELQAAGERSWGKPFDGKADPMYFVVQKETVTMLKAGTHVVQLLHADQPYLGDRRQVSDRLPRKEQKQVWMAHTAWAALDLWDREPSKEEAYAVLARFAAQLTDGNCCAVYLPKDNVLMPNDGAAEEGLRMLLAGHTPE